MEGAIPTTILEVHRYFLKPRSHFSTCVVACVSRPTSYVDLLKAGDFWTYGVSRRTASSRRIYTVRFQLVYMSVRGAGVCGAWSSPAKLAGARLAGDGVWELRRRGHC